LKKGEYTVTQWTKKKSEVKELETDNQANFILDDIEFSVIKSSDISPIVIAKNRDIDVSAKVTELEVSNSNDDGEKQPDKEE
jgi:hypothetical protein